MGSGSPDRGRGLGTNQPGQWLRQGDRWGQGFMLRDKRCMLLVTVVKAILCTICKYTRDLFLDWEVTMPLSVAMGKLLETKLLGGEGDGG